MSDIRPGRLNAEQIAGNFADLHPPLSRREALVEADRCYFCFDAPCTTACPTGIDIPAFIQKIRSDNRLGSAQTILSDNIMGGMCARVCPTEVLCEEACVRNTQGDKPIEIGLLQRYATDPVFDGGVSMFSRAERSGRQVAVIGAGPGGLSCAHRLAMLGHDVVVFDRNPRPGGLNEYGIAAYKTVDDFAQREVEFILSIGGIALRQGVVLGEDISLAGLMEEFDALFIGIGLGGVNALGIDGEDLDGVVNAIDYIAELRQAADKHSLPVGRRIVVIGGGMTAIDVAVQSRRLGAEQVDIVYRRDRNRWAPAVSSRNWRRRTAFRYVITGNRCACSARNTSRPSSSRRYRSMPTASCPAPAKPIRSMPTSCSRQSGSASLRRVCSKPALPSETARSTSTTTRRHRCAAYWAGGDCVAGGDDLTVTAVQHGKLAAISIDRYLRSREGKHG